jgi:hypothetical protein
MFEVRISACWDGSHSETLSLVCWFKIKKRVWVIAKQTNVSEHIEVLLRLETNENAF